MKKALVILSVLCCMACSNSQQSKEIIRLDQAEINECKTPNAVAYRFVTSIIEEDYATAVEMMSSRYFFELMPILFYDGVPIEQLFSSEYTHDIVDMRPVVEQGYEVVITDSHPVDPEKNVSENSESEEPATYSVTFGCADANNKLYNGKKDNYDTETTVLLIQEDEDWRVLEFK